MPIEIIDLCPDFFRFWDDSRDMPIEEQCRRWYSDYADRHPGIFDLYLERWASTVQIEPAIRRYTSNEVDLRAVAEQLVDRLPGALQACLHHFQVPDIDLPVVLLVGLYSSDGWGTVFEGRPTIFFAVEYVPPPPFLDMFLVHELAHAVHLELGAADWRGTIGEALFLEGLAMTVSQQVVPGFSDATYAWCRPCYDTWLDDCLRAWPDLRSGLLSVFDRDDIESYMPYFSPAAANVRHSVSKPGYAVGQVIVKTLLKHVSIAELGRWTEAQVAQEVRRVLEQTEIVEGR